MSFEHERLDVYRAAIEDIDWAEHAAVGIDSDADTDSDPEGRGRAERVPNRTLTPDRRYGADRQPGSISVRRRLVTAGR